MAVKCACGRSLGLFERLRHSTCERCREREAQEWANEVEESVRAANEGLLPQGRSSSYVMDLAADEVVHFETTGARLLKIRKEYVRYYHGVSLPIGGSGVRYHTGTSTGRMRQGNFEVADTGAFVITSSRTIFLGNGHTHVTGFRKLVDVRVLADAIQFHLSNRVTPVTIQLGAGSTDIAAARLNTAMRIARGELVAPQESTPPLPASAQAGSAGGQQDQVAEETDRVARLRSLEAAFKEFSRVLLPAYVAAAEHTTAVVPLTPEEHVNLMASVIIVRFATTDGVLGSEETVLLGLDRQDPSIATVAALAGGLGPESPAFRAQAEKLRNGPAFSQVVGPVFKLRGETAAEEVIAAASEFASAVCAIDGRVAAEAQELEKFRLELSAALETAKRDWA